MSHYSVKTSFKKRCTVQLLRCGRQRQLQLFRMERRIELLCGQVPIFPVLVSIDPPRLALFSQYNASVMFWENRCATQVYLNFNGEFFCGLVN